MIAFSDFDRELTEKSVETSRWFWISDDLFFFQGKDDKIEIFDRQPGWLKSVFTSVDSAKAHIDLFLKTIHIVELSRHVY